MAVAEILGHADASVTERIYLHAMPGDNERAAELYQEHFGAVVASSNKRQKKTAKLVILPGPYVTPDVTTCPKPAVNLYKIKG